MRQGIENLANRDAALLVSLRIAHLLRLLAQHQQVDAKNLSHLFAPSAGDAGSKREQLRSQRQPAQLRAPPPVGGADMLSVPRLAVRGIERSLEKRAPVALDSIVSLDGTSVRRRSGNGDTPIGKVPGRVECEATPVRATPHHGQGKAGTRGALAPMVDAEFAGAAILTRTHSLQGKLRLQRAVGPSSVWSHNEGFVFSLHGAARSW